MRNLRQYRGLDIDFIGDCILQGLSERSAVQAAHSGRQFISWARCELSDVSPNQARSYIMWLLTSESHRGRSRSPNTIYLALTNLKKWAAYYVDVGEIEINPFAGLKGPKRLYKMMTPISDADLMMALGWVHMIGGDFRLLKARNAAAVYVLADTGVRSAELLSMTRSGLEDGFIVVPGKGSKERRVPITPPVRRLIDRYLAMRFDPFDHLWINKHNEPWTHPGIRTMLKTLTKHSGVHVSTHAFRRKALTMLAEDGMAQAHLRAISGHASDHALLPYIHAADATKAIEEHGHISPVARMMAIGDA